jgi:DNA-directed RNA polymerase specialized sigma24 family protein
MPIDDPLKNLTKKQRKAIVARYADYATTGRPSPLRFVAQVCGVKVSEASRLCARGLEQMSRDGWPIAEWFTNRFQEAA